MSVGDFVDEDGVTRLRGTYSGGGSLPVGAGSPVGVVTPSGIGALYVDTTSGGLWIATGATSADWLIVGGAAASGGAVGVEVYASVSPRLTAAAGSNVTLQDAPGIAGTGNALVWNAGAADGDQNVELIVGSSGQFDHHWTSDGTYHNANGIIFPTADPHVAGAWWDNAGTLTKSLG